VEDPNSVCDNSSNDGGSVVPRIGSDVPKIKEDDEAIEKTDDDDDDDQCNENDNFVVGETEASASVSTMSTKKWCRLMHSTAISSQVGRFGREFGEKFLGKFSASGSFYYEPLYEIFDTCNDFTYII
jgi:hypothetical protein